ncbi:MAG: hypothetical protein ABI846_08905 [Rudaea sp.]
MPSDSLVLDLCDAEQRNLGDYERLERIFEGGMVSRTWRVDPSSLAKSPSSGRSVDAGAPRRKRRERHPQINAGARDRRVAADIQPAKK